MDTHNAAIEDGGTPKGFDDPTLSPRARKIAKRVAKAHVKWLRIARWGQHSVWTRDPTAIPVKEALAYRVYDKLAKQLTWPLWSIKMTDPAIRSQMFAIHAAFRRIGNLVPDALLSGHERVERT
jgi:hypothetical protein